MIPKLFHVVWLGKTTSPLSKDQLTNINTWLLKNPEYKLYVWTNNSLSNDDAIINRHVNNNHLAGASDLLRLKMLYEYGGIYLDDDTICYKSFDPLLNHKCFMGVDHGYEDVTVINNAIIGAEKNNPFIKQMYEKGLELFRYNDITYPFGYVTVDLLKPYGFKRGYSNLADEGAHIIECNDVTIYPGDFFYPGYGGNKQNENTYSRHLYGSRW